MSRHLNEGGDVTFADVPTSGGDAGAALVLALMIVGLLCSLGLSMLMVTDTERHMAANARDAGETVYAADAGVSRAIADLADASQWNGALAGTEHSAFADSVTNPVLPSGHNLDLSAATSELQTESESAGTFGPDTPVWRLYAWGSLSHTASPGVIDSPEYLAVWIADDPADADGNPAVDSNGRVCLHAEAHGLGGARRVVEATVARVQPRIVRMLAWREVR